VYHKNYKTEIFDIVNTDDQVIGQAERSEVHGNPDLIHRVIHILVFNSDGQIYLQKRSLTKDVQPGKWDTSVGGHLDSGESYSDAAIREMKEELGIEGVTLEFLYSYLHTSDFETEYVSTYSCIWDGDIVTELTEIDEGRFWEMEEIDKQISQDLFTPLFREEMKLYRMFVLGE